MIISNKQFSRHESTLEHLYDFNSTGLSPDFTNDYTGYIKCKLVHREDLSNIIPELLIFGENSFKWIQHFKFLGVWLAQLDDDLVVCTMFLDISLGQTIKISFKNKDLIKVYQDNSCLYRCTVNGASDLLEYITGSGYFDRDMVPFLRLYHHTKDDTKKIIEKSKVLKSSNWNLQGTKLLTNLSFLYFTCIDKITRPGDLTQIAMSSRGKLSLIVDNFDQPGLLPPDYLDKYRGKILEIKVYRESTDYRTATLYFDVNATNIYTPNLWLHKPNDGATYYEICSPFVYRVGVEYNGFVAFSDSMINVSHPPIQQYVVIGDCTHTSGLEAPFDEENTSEIFKIEPLYTRINILDFWFEKGNTDLYSNKAIDLMQFE